jgi:hypothetical protein
MKKFGSVLVFMLLVLCSCNKNNEPQLTDATHIGANTLSCLVNGRVFVASGKTYSGHEQGVNFIPFTNIAWWVAGSTSTEKVSLDFDYNKNPGVPGTFELAHNYPSGGTYVDNSDGSATLNGGYYETDSVNKGFITLAYYDGNIAAGTFEFDCKNPSGKIVHITEGRFDISIK